MDIKIKTVFGRFLGLFFNDKEYEFEVPISEATKKQAALMKLNAEMKKKKRNETRRI